MDINLGIPMVSFSNRSVIDMVVYYKLDSEGRKEIKGSVIDNFTKPFI